MPRKPIARVLVNLYEEDSVLIKHFPPYGRGAWLKEAAKRGLATNPEHDVSGTPPDTARQIEEEIADWLRNDIVPELIEIIREEVRNEVRRALEGQAPTSTVVTDNSPDEDEETSDPIETWQPTKAWIDSLRG